MQISSKCYPLNIIHSKLPRISCHSYVYTIYCYKDNIYNIKSIEKQYIHNSYKMRIHSEMLSISISLTHSIGKPSSMNKHQGFGLASKSILRGTCTDSYVLRKRQWKNKSWHRFTDIQWLLFKTGSIDKFRLLSKKQ